MQSVSVEFQTAALSATMIPVREVTLTLLDNVSIGTGLTPAASSIDSSVVGADKAVNGYTKAGRRWAAADHFTTIAAGARNIPKYEGDADAIYPIGVLSEAGWWGDTVSDASGNIGGGGEVFESTYDRTVSVVTISWYGETFLGLPVDFTVDYDPTGSAGWINVGTVTNYDLDSWLYTFPAETLIRKVRITITKVSLPFVVAKLIEFGAGLDINVSALAGRISVLSERQAESATLQVGNASANSLNLSMDNSTGLFSPNNADSPYHLYLRSNRKTVVRVGFQFDDGSTEMVSLGTFYSMAWDAPGGGPLVSLRAQDRMKRLRERKYRTCPLSVGLTVDAIIRQTLIDAGLNVAEFEISASTSTIPYAWCSPTTSYFEYIAQLAAATGGVVYFDQQDIFHYEDAVFLKNNRVASVITLTDDNAVITAVDTWDEGKVKNRVAVSVNTLKVAPLAEIWSLQEPLTVISGGTLTINVAFSAAALSVAAPVITGGADIVVQSWTVYAMVGVLVIENTGITDQTVTAITVDGQALGSDGSNIVIAEDTDLVATDGAREFQLSNAFIQNRTPATTLAYNLLNLQKNPPSQLKIETVGLPHLELGDRIRVNSAILGIDQDYWLIRHTFNDDGGFRSSLDVVAVFGELPTRATLWHDEAIPLVGNALLSVIDEAQPYSKYSYQSAAANGDTTTNSFFIRAGIYTLYILGRTGIFSGKIGIYLDDVLTFNQDWYSSGEAVVTRVCPGVIIATDGVHTIKTVITGKATDSLDYRLMLTKMWLKPETTAYSLDATAIASAALPTRAELWHRESIVTVGSAITASVDGNQQHTHYAGQTASADGNSFTQSFFVRAGTYTFSATGLTHSVYGKIDWYIDNVLAVSGQDWYAGAGPNYNVTKTASVTITGDGYHTLRGTVNGKNAGSPTYFIFLTRLEFRQASD